jgi:hypothetical protein
LLQYFNVEKMGRLPNGTDALFTTRMGVFTKLAAAQETKGSQVFVITGLGKPKRYYLWETFTIRRRARFALRERGSIEYKRAIS